MPQLPHPALPHPKANESVRRDPATCDPTVPMLRTPIHVMYRGLHARSRRLARQRLRMAFHESFAALRTLLRECRWSLSVWLRPRAKTQNAEQRVKRSEPRAAFVMTVLGLASGVLLMKNLSRLDIMTPHASAETVIGHALALVPVQPEARAVRVASQLASMCMAGADVVAPPAAGRVSERHEPPEKSSKAGASRRDKNDLRAAKPTTTDSAATESGSHERKAVLRREAAQAERAEHAMAHFAQKTKPHETKHEPRARTKPAH